MAYRISRMALTGHARPVTDLEAAASPLAVQNLSARDIVSRAAELLWVIARCDVENVSAHRTAVLDRLRDLENLAASMNIPDLYRQALEL